MVEKKVAPDGDAFAKDPEFGNVRPLKLDEYGGGELGDHISAQETYVFRALLWTVPGLYGFWYVVTTILMLGFGDIANFRGDEPFDHVRFSPVAEAGSWIPLVNWLSMVLTMTIAGPWLICFAIREAPRATDCSSAMGALHFFACTVVTQHTPENWQWFATFMPCTIFMGRMAEFLLSRFSRPRRGRRREMSFGGQRSL